MIDLGIKRGSTDLAISAPATPSPSDKSYPTFYFTAPCDCEMPDVGTAKIKFRKVEDAENTRNPGEPQYRYELEVHGIEVISGGEDDMDVGDSLKRAMRKKMAEKMGKDEDGD